MGSKDKELKIKRLQDNLQPLRQLAGLSAAQLADEIDVTKQTIHRLESKENPTKMTFTQYVTIRLVLDEIVKEKINKDPNDTVLKDTIELLLDKSDELNEEEYTKIQNAVKIISASAAAGVAGALLFPAVIPGIVGGVLGAKILGLLPGAAIGSGLISGLWFSDTRKSKKEKYKK